MRRSIVEYKVPASYLSTSLFAAQKRKLSSTDNSGTKNFNSTIGNEDEEFSGKREIGIRNSDYNQYKNKNDNTNENVNMNDIPNNEILIENKNRYKNKTKKRQLKSRKQNQVREERTWNVQSMLICNGKNKNTSFTSTSTTQLTALPCVDILSEIKAQGNKLIFILLLFICN